MFTRPAGVAAAAAVAMWLSAGSASAVTSNFVVSPLAFQTAGPPFPATTAVVTDIYNAVLPPNPIRTHTVGLTLLDFLPADPSRIVASDNGTPDVLGTAATFDVFWHPPNPIFPPNPCIVDMRFDFLQEVVLGDNSVILPLSLVGLPAVQFGDSFFDVFFEVDLGPMGTQMHTLHGDISDPSLFRFANVEAVAGSLDLTLTLKPVANTLVTGETQLVRMTLTGNLQPAIPEPATVCLGSIIAAALGLRRRRAAA